MLRTTLEEARELARQEWSGGLETYLALGCYFWLIFAVVASLAAAVSWGVTRVLEML